MRDRGIDRDHQIERGDDRRGVGEIGERIVEAGSGGLRERRAVGLAGVLLQADEGDARRASSGANCARGMLRLWSFWCVGLPDQTRPTRGPRAGQARAPFFHALGRRVQIRHRRRDGGERGAEGERQAHQRAMQIERRQRLAAPQDRARRRRCRSSGLQIVGNFQHHLAPFAATSGR